MATNSVVRLDKIQSVYFGGGHIHSVEAPSALQNGFVAKLTGYKAGEREIETIAEAGTDSKVVLIANPAVNYDQSRMSLNSEQEYSIESGDIARAYDLTEGDVFSVTVEGLTLLGANPVVGNFLVGSATDFKLAEATAVTTETFVGKIIRVDTVGTNLAINPTAGYTHRQLKYAVIQVVKNG